MVAIVCFLPEDKESDMIYSSGTEMARMCWLGVVPSPSLQVKLWLGVAVEATSLYMHVEKKDRAPLPKKDWTHFW